MTSLLACSFDRSPLYRASAGEGASASASMVHQTSDQGSDGRGVATGSADNSGRGDNPRDAGEASRQGKSGGATRDNSGDPDGGSESDDGGAASDGGGPTPLRCHDVYCPLSSGRTKSCCTTHADVERHGARAVEACGVDLSALDSAQFGTGCWQRDQLGIIDGRCPPRSGEPGCCADDGFCGTNNAEHHLGCFHAAGSKLRACRRDMEPSTAACDPRGRYALRVTVDAAWDGRNSGLAALTDDGRGEIQIYLLVHIQDVDPSSNEVKAAARLCGVTLPPFYSSTLCESYQARFSDSLWESARLPRPALGGHYECAADGCVMSLGPTTYLFGIRLDNPEATWPTPRQTASLHCPDLPGQDCFADDDDDGDPGVSVHIDTHGSVDTGGTCRAYNYRAAPLNDTIAAIFNGVRRADRLHVGIRARVGGSVRFGDNCTTAAGSALVEYVNSRAEGCYVQQGTYDVLQNTGPAGPKERCRPSEAHFIDLSMPVYRVLSAGERPGASRSNRDNSPSKGPTVSVARFATDAAPGCADVRAAF